MLSRFGYPLAAVALFVCVSRPACANDDVGTPWRVLILDSSDASEPVAQSFGRAIRQVLTTRASRPIDFYTEFMDSLRFPGSSYESEFVAFLTQKYKGRQPDIVVTVYPEALAFFGRHRDDLWAHTPAVFVGIPDDLPDAHAPPPGVTGVLTHVDFAGTVDLLLRLQPDTERVVVVSGAADFDRLWRVRAEAALRAHADRLEIRYFDSLSIPDLLEQVSHLPPKTIVLHTTVFRDPQGRANLPLEVTRQVAGASRVPVYCMFEPTLGVGIVGGSMVPLEAEAYRAGEMALAILNGASPDGMAVEPSPRSQPRVDWRQMRRFGLSDAALPPGTVVLFKPSSIWDQYRGRIIGGLSIVVLEFALIVALLVERRLRRRAELRSQRQTVELAHASRLATVGEITASIAHQVNQPLGAILSNADAAEMLLDAKPLPVDELRQILIDIRRDDERASEVIRGMRALLRRREIDVRPIDLNDAIAEVLRLLDGESRRHGVVLDPHLAETLPPVAGDRVHLQQVVLNLLVNGIEAAADADRDSRRMVSIQTTSAGGEVEVLVRDTGRGISPDQLPRLFDSFVTTKKDGMGLGLSIARSLVEAHGGRIWAENKPGGATFRFTLPVHDSGAVPDADTATGPRAATGPAILESTS